MQQWQLGGGTLAVPVTAQAADPCTNPKTHFSSWTLTPGNGQITIQWASSIPNFCKQEWSGNRMSLLLAEEEIEGAEDKTASDLSGEAFDDGGYQWAAQVYGSADGKKTITGLTNGITYYVYAQIYITDGFNDTEGLHKLLLVGNVTPDASLSNAPVVSPSDSSSSNSASSTGSSSVSASAGSSDQEKTVSYEDEVTEEIEAAPSGSTVVMDEGISALSNSVMKELAEKGDVSLRMEFTYQDKEYVIVIPAGAALDNDIPWYGPLYLAQHFGNRAGTAAAGEGGTYEVKSGDSLSRIARANNMTLQQLLAKNPQIKDPNKITVGQRINR
ncbi:MAG: LysM domain-containing protein [Muribaculaceae bacterium]|nr:LysM domain-containing protein [Muribaculaceae bacterium]